jgi:hypothetical protein
VPRQYRPPRRELDFETRASIVRCVFYAWAASEVFVFARHLMG